ncbi:putative acyltransferase [Corynebacterium ciconiae DSM 44920]|uniref:GNAT family N-acetyltransferase n=1 Tax=Corynebacterium ciconiae TaxID=227319 RepID=UPI00036ED29E|nr:GNAT family N-acetyltransferase [Corynebacterium ciconiae]WKD62017.1 putative acyltransferase [Corynebacterium ciconiae DSM 44920]
MTTYFSVSHLGHLSAKEVHQLYKLRVDVFVAEQHCPYHEIDDVDLQASTMHIMARNGSRLVGCARMVPTTFGEFAAATGASAEELEADTAVVQFGRLALEQDARGTGLAPDIIDQALKMAAGQFSGQPVVLAAQSGLESYYERFGFTRCGEEFDDAGTPHIPMVRR